MASVQSRDMIVVAAQLSWDEQGIVKGDTVEVQMRQAYANIEKLLEYHGAKISDVIEETVFVTDMKAALALAQKVRRDVFGNGATVTSSIIEVSRLADPKALVAIRATAKLDMPMSRSQHGDSGRRPSSWREVEREGGGGLPPFWSRRRAAPVRAQFSFFGEAHGAHDGERRNHEHADTDRDPRIGHARRSYAVRLGVPSPSDAY